MVYNGPSEFHKCWFNEKTGTRAFINDHLIRKTISSASQYFYFKLKKTSTDIFTSFLCKCDLNLKWYYKQTDKVNTYRLALDIMLYFRSMETNEARDSLLFFMSVLFSKVIAFSCNYWKSNSYTVTAWSQIFALSLISTLVKVANLDILI